MFNKRILTIRREKDFSVHRMAKCPDGLAKLHADMPLAAPFYRIFFGQTLLETRTKDTGHKTKLTEEKDRIPQHRVVVWG